MPRASQRVQHKLNPEYARGGFAMQKLLTGSALFVDLPSQTTLT
jgi:hypothetical protein